MSSPNRTEYAEQERLRELQEFQDNYKRAVRGMDKRFTLVLLMLAAWAAALHYRVQQVPFNQPFLRTMAEVVQAGSTASAKFFGASWESVARGFAGVPGMLLDFETFMLAYHLPVIAVGIMALLTLAARIRGTSTMYELSRAEIQDGRNVYTAAFRTMRTVYQMEVRTVKVAAFFLSISLTCSMLDPAGRAWSHAHTVLYFALTLFIFYGRVRIPELFLAPEIKVLADKSLTVHESLETYIYQRWLDDSHQRRHNFYAPTVLD